MRLDGGKFAGAGHEPAVRAWCASQVVGAGPVAVVGASQVVNVVRAVASSKTYRDSAVLASLKVLDAAGALRPVRSEEHTSELQSLMRISYAVFCLKKKTQNIHTTN